MSQRVSLTQFKAVLFDVDGTLIDTLEVIVRGLGDTYEKFANQRPSAAAIRSLIGMPLREQLKLYRDTPPTDGEIEMMTHYTISRFEAHKECEAVFAPALDTLALCHRSGLKTALVTSKNSVELRMFMEKFSHREYLDATICASDVVRPKPDPESARLACERLGVLASEAIMIGDSVYDIRCARAAGVAAVAVCYGSATRDSLESEQPDLVLETPEGLLRWAEDALLETSCRERRI
jgi:pyrophosphatase PpaX